MKLSFKRLIFMGLLCFIPPAAASLQLVATLTKSNTNLNLS
jgi:hypothetical protein